MATTRIALANVRYPHTPDESVNITVDTIAKAGERLPGDAANMDLLSDLYGEHVFRPL